MRRIGRIAVVLLVLVVGGWLALLRYGGRPAPRPAPPPSVKPQAAARTGLLAVPVAGVDRARIAPSWGDPRDNGLRAHHGTDIIAPGGASVTAAAPGVVEKLWNSAQGGMTLYVRSPDRRWSYYYAHLAGYAAGIAEGAAVRTGQLLGYVGDSGNAGKGNFHLHFGLLRTDPGQHWYQGRDVDPFPYLTGRTAPAPTRVAAAPPAR